MEVPLGFWFLVDRGQDRSVPVLEDLYHVCGPERNLSFHAAWCQATCIDVIF